MKKLTSTKERPIIFSGEMVRAILDGRKTQTRRVVKYMPDLGEPNEWCHKANSIKQYVGDYRRYCHLGITGDRLWVRESFFQNRYDNGGYEEGLVRYCADEDDFAMENPETKTVKRPSIHMPRWASRITLEIVDVRVERVQAISKEDAKAEGIRPFEVSHQTTTGRVLKSSYLYIRPFSELWNSINAKKGFGWDTNPWVWVIEFKILEVG